jgi:hypothetical protein
MQSTDWPLVLAGCTDRLVEALSGAPSKSLQENVAGALWSLSNNEAVAVVMDQTGATAALVEVARCGRSKLARAHAAGALLHFSRLK